MADMTRAKEFLFSRATQVLIDTVIFSVAYFLSYLIRFEGLPPGLYLKQMLSLWPVVVLARHLAFSLFQVYRIIWRFISVREAVGMFAALLPLSVILTLARLWLPSEMDLFRLPVSVIVMEFMLSTTGTISARIIWRIYCENARRERLRAVNPPPSRRVKTLLIGAGSAGNMIAKELRQRVDLAMELVGFIDDNPKQKGKRIQGIRVLGGTDKLPQIASQLGAEEAIISIVNATSKEIRRIAGVCDQAGLRTRIVPGLFEMLDKRISITKVRNIKIDDLLGRSVVHAEDYLEEVSSFYRGKRILVTGAGGSIGSELCRQLATMDPEEIVLLDKDENSIFEIDNNLKERYFDGSGPRIHPVIASIKNAERLRILFERYRPQIVFHAAAHKHVPLMELNVGEAILNNVFGTRNVVEAADGSGVERFIFISTDKAVNPTNVMGATKKIGEVIVQQTARTSATKFACVRFGNVLGSRGSAVPLFEKQIARGGPVTVTHPDVQRYFMSIPEAVHLIIQAGTLCERGEIFVLDMGRPIKIVDLVHTLIRLSGHPADDIEIKFIGLRPGEKLFEEILIDEERHRATKFEKIFVAPPPEAPNGKAHEALGDVLEAAKAGDEGQIIELLSGMGIGFHRPDQGRGQG